MGMRSGAWVYGKKKGSLGGCLFDLDGTPDGLLGDHEPLCLVKLYRTHTDEVHTRGEVLCVEAHVIITNLEVSIDERPDDCSLCIDDLDCRWSRDADSEGQAGITRTYWIW